MVVVDVGAEKDKIVRKRRFLDFLQFKPHLTLEWNFEPVLLISILLALLLKL